jgi:pyridoxal phosphate enzyme (YggS family)
VTDHYTADQVRGALERLRTRIAQIERPWTHPVEITAVTKAFSPSVIDAAVDAGLTSIGENYAQDLLSKRDEIERRHEAIRVDFIGHLQSNKVRQIADLVDRWCTVDRESIVVEIAKRAPGADVLIQVNATGEASKSGCEPDDVESLHRRCLEVGVRPRGILAIGPTDRPAEDAEAAFRLTRGLVDELGLEVCSMGMSGDLDVAVACGSTNVRIGAALFGARPGSPSPVGVHHERDASG